MRDVAGFEGLQRDEIDLNRDAPLAYLSPQAGRGRVTHRRCAVT
jgi:hypothetical protein